MAWVDVKKRNKQVESAIRKQIQRNMSVFRDRFAKKNPTDADYIRTFGVSKRTIYRQMEQPMRVDAGTIVAYQNYARINGIPDYITEAMAKDG